MRKIVEYIVACETEPESLSAAVGDFLSQEYELYGYLTISKTSNNEEWFYQAMVKYEDEGTRCGEGEE